MNTNDVDLDDDHATLDDLLNVLKSIRAGLFVACVMLGILIALIARLR